MHGTMSLKNMWLVHLELNDLYSLPIIIRAIKSRRMRWAVQGREERSIQGFGGET